MTVAQVSENVGDHLSLGVEDALGRPLSEIVDPAGADEVRDGAARRSAGTTRTRCASAHRGKQFDGIVHRHEGAAILELEPNPDTPEEQISTHPFRAALLRMQRRARWPSSPTIVVQEMRRTTGFERVMFYRFHEDGSGSVDAEAKEAALEPYLGLHYPASDIPAQARRLYLKNWLRLIFDARPEASADRSDPATRHRRATRPQLLGAAQRLADSPRVHGEHGRPRVDEHLAHRSRIRCGGSSAA